MNLDQAMFLVGALTDTVRQLQAEVARLSAKIEELQSDQSDAAEADGASDSAGSS